MTQASTSTQDAIGARHQAWLEEAGTMTMDLARKAHRRAAAQLDDDEPAPPTVKDEATRFAALVRCLRQTVAAEARIAAGPAPRTVRTVQATQLLRAASPRLVLLRRTLHHAVRNDPDRASLRRAVDADIIDLARTDPAGTTPIQHILLAITDKHAIHLDLAQIPDALLGNPEDDFECVDPLGSPTSDPLGSPASDPPESPADHPTRPGTTDPPT